MARRCSPAARVQGESDIRKWIIENDWLEAIVALPEQMFYNTGIGTYIWIVTNRKEKRRKGKIQLFDAREIYVPMRRSLGDKRRKIGRRPDAEDGRSPTRSPTSSRAMAICDLGSFIRFSVMKILAIPA